ncbi:MAG: hypothetical protein EA385_15100 [Salinarimonadaceae bacterium]|nr:MAG: hypothetical protein EA385_15100 [Salinarimonadaceae bacterium]
MIITGTRATRATLSPTYWHGDYAAYRNAGGFILAYIPTRESVFFQPGDEAAAFEEVADAAMALCADDDDTFAWHNAMGNYLDFMVSPDEAGGAPSSDGGFFALFAGG